MQNAERCRRELLLTNYDWESAEILRAGRVIIATNERGTTVTVRGFGLLHRQQFDPLNRAKLMT